MVTLMCTHAIIDRIHIQFFVVGHIFGEINFKSRLWQHSPVPVIETLLNNLLITIISQKLNI